MKTVVSLALGLLLFMACGHSKGTYVSDFRNFVENVQKNAVNYTKTDWEKANAKYEEFTNQEYNKYKSNLTQSEKAEVNKLKGIYSALRIKEGAERIKNNIKEGVDNAVDKTKKAAQDVKEDLK